MSFTEVLAIRYFVMASTQWFKYESYTQNPSNQKLLKLDGGKLHDIMMGVKTHFSKVGGTYRTKTV